MTPALVLHVLYFKGDFFYNWDRNRVLSDPRYRPFTPVLVDSEVRGTTLQKLIVDSEVRGTTIGFFFCNIGLFFATFEKCRKLTFFATFLLQTNVAWIFGNFTIVAKQNVANFSGEIRMLQKSMLQTFCDIVECWKNHWQDHTPLLITNQR